MSTHEDKTNDFDFDHDELANEDTEKDNVAGPLMDRANPLYSSLTPSVDVDANIIPLAGAWAVLAHATSDWDIKRPFGPVTAQVHRFVGAGQESHVDAAHA
jgi:pyrimidine and pyridine-specific 5'-nucleotidase